MKKLTTVIVLAAVVSAIAIFLSLFLTSMHIVEINHFGLLYRNLDNVVEDDVYESGRHFSGIGTRFIEFPSTIIIFEFSNSTGADYSTINAWTINGQSIYIEISFYAKFINKHKIKDFYFNFSSQWKGYFLRMAYAKIKEITTTFGELDFYQKRASINQQITKELSELFLNQSNNVLNVTEVQLRKIDLDSDLESAVEDKLIELQSQRKWQIQQNITMIVKQTELITQWADNNITLLYANATAYATQIMAKADAQAIQQEYEGYAVGFSTLNNQVDFSNNNAFLSFMFAEMLSKVTNQTNINLGFNNPGVLTQDLQSIS